MNRVSENPYPSQTQPSVELPSDTPATGGFDYRRAWREPQGIGIGAAVALTAGASLATFIIMRRRARARMDRLAWLALRAALLRAMLPRAAGGAAKVATVGGGLAAAAILQDRLRHGHSHTAIEGLNARLEALQAEAQARIPSNRPRPRDVAIGAVAGVVLAGIIGRIGAGRKAS
jgi:hypothetical protein